MKKTLLNIVAIATIGFATTAQNVNIPDANFKAYLVGNSSINTNMDSEIQVSEANSYSGGISISTPNISNLTGLEAFTSLTSFSYPENNFTSLDFSQNTALTTISCYYSYNLTSINLSQNVALTVVDLSYSPSIVNLNFSSNINLELLYLEICYSLATVDISQNTALTTLSVRDCNISSIDVSQNTLLENFKCEGNNLTALDVTKNTALKWFSCFDNNIGILDVSRNTAMTTFQCFNNDLTILNMRNLNTTTLPQINADGNPNLTCIDVDDVSASTSAWTYVDPGVVFSLNCEIDLVNSITVEGQAGATFISTPAGTLQMIANIYPTYADDNTYTWSVTNGTGSATIDANGILTAVTDGTVTVTATANDGTGVSGSEVITIFNQTAGINDQTAMSNVIVYPNPAKSSISIDSETEVKSIVFINLMGEKVKTIVAPTHSVDVADLAKGVYMLQIQFEYFNVNQKLIKE